MIGLTTQPTKGHLYKKGTTITQSHGKTRNPGPKVYGQKKKLQRISAMKTWYLTEPGIISIGITASAFILFTRPKSAMKPITVNGKSSKMLQSGQYSKNLY